MKMADVSTDERQYDRMSAYCDGTPDAYMDIDLTTLIPQIALTHRGSPWIAGRHYATGYSAYSLPNAKVPGLWLRGSELIYHGAASNHPGIVVVGNADGSVRNISDTISLDVWRAMATTSGGETNTNL